MMMTMLLSAVSADEAVCVNTTAKPILRYFDVRGRGEAIRMALSDYGVEFEDAAFTGAEWGKDREDGLKAKLMREGKAPFVRAPVDLWTSGLCTGCD